MTCALASEGFRQWCSSIETHPTACCLGITSDVIIADNYGSRSDMDNVQMLVRKCSRVPHQWREEAGGAEGMLGLDVGQVVVLAGPPACHPCLVRYQTQDASWGRGGRGSAVEGGRDAIGGGRPAGGSSFQLRSSRGAGRGGLSASCSPFNRDSLFFFFLVAPHGMQDLSSLARDRTPHPLNWQHAVLTTGPLGKSRPGFILEGWLS